MSANSGEQSRIVNNVNSGNLWQIVANRVPSISQNRAVNLAERRMGFTNTAAKRMRMRQIWHFRFAQFFLVLCLFSRKFYKVCNKQLSLLLQQKSSKEYAFLFLNFISLSGKEIPKILAAIQGVRTSVSACYN